MGINFYLEDGGLSVQDIRPFRRPNGRFDPGRAVDFVRRTMDDAARERGTPGGAVPSLEMPDPDQVVPYEALLNRFLPGSRCLALCLYDRRRFPADALLAVMESHPLAAIGADICDNLYCMSPAQDLPPADSAALKLDTWLDRLVARRSSDNQIGTLTRKLMQTQEDERRMISRELHDRVGQDLLQPADRTGSADGPAALPGRSAGADRAAERPPRPQHPRRAGPGL